MAQDSSRRVPENFLKAFAGRKTRAAEPQRCSSLPLAGQAGSLLECGALQVPGLRELVAERRPGKRPCRLSPPAALAEVEVEDPCGPALVVGFPPVRLLQPQVTGTSGRPSCLAGTKVTPS